MHRPTLLAATAAAAVVLLAGCGGSSDGSGPLPAEPATTGTAGSGSPTSVGLPSATASSAPSSALSATGSGSAAAAAPAKTSGGAGELVTALHGRIRQVKLTQAFTSDDDPDQLLGMPGAYVGKAAFSDSRVTADDRNEEETDVVNGGAVEVFRSPAQARARRAYVNTIVNASDSETLDHEYLYVSGKVLLRVSSALPAATARQYAKALPKAITASR